MRRYTSHTYTYIHTYMHVQAPSVFTASELVAGVAEHYFIAPQVQVVEKHGRQLASSV